MAQAGACFLHCTLVCSLFFLDDVPSRAIADDVALPLSANAKQRGLRYWMVTCFDLANFKVPEHDERFSYMVYQVETCPETKRDHIQGYLELSAQTRFSQVKQMFAPAVVHLEARKAKTAGPAIAYCMKEDTRKDGPWEFGERPTEGKKKPDPIDWTSVRTKVQACKSWNEVLQTDDAEVIRATANKLNYVKELFAARPVNALPPNIVLRKWQRRVLNMLDEQPVKRRIIWIWSEKSGTGKTTFFDFVSSKYNVLPGADWANTLFVYDGQTVLWYDRTRSQSTDVRGVDQFYSDLERFSNCSVHSSTKYQGGRKLVNVHVVVTANAGPDDFRLPGRFVEVVAKTAEEEEDETMEHINELEAIIEEQENMDILNDNVATPQESHSDASEEESEDQPLEKKPKHVGSEHPPADFAGRALSLGTPNDSVDLFAEDMDVDSLPDDFGQDDVGTAPTEVIEYDESEDESASSSSSSS